MQNILAVDTSTENCSVAVLTRQGIFCESKIVPQKHAELVLGMTDGVLKKAGIKREDLEGIVFGMGPGSFTGVRIAASTAQGLALGLNLRVVGVSSLEALALQALEGCDEDYAVSAIDARMGEVYLAVFRRNGSGLLKIVSEQVLKPEAAVFVVKEALGSNYAVGGGSGIELLYDAGLNKNIRKRSQFPDAESIVKIGSTRFDENGSLDPSEALPLYVRNEVTWKKLEEQKKTTI